MSNKNKPAVQEQPEVIQEAKPTEPKPAAAPDPLAELFEGEALEQAKALRKAGWTRHDEYGPYFKLPESKEGRATFKNEIDQTEDAHPERKYTVDEAWRIHCLQIKTRKARQAAETARQAKQVAK